MLTQIKLTNFKCFKEETTFPLSKFNLFTGANGAGKSTLLQSLLIMRQSIDHNPYTSELILNGSCVNLGSFDDVRNKNISASEPILFEFNIRNISRFGVSENSVFYKLKAEDKNVSLFISEILLSQYNPLEEFPRFQKDNTKYHWYYKGKELYELSGDDSNPPHLCRLIKLAPHYFNIEKDKTYPLIKDEAKKYSYHTETRKNSNHDFSLSWFGFFCFDDEKEQDNLNFEKIHFISADRIGPQEIYLKSNLSDFAHVGTKGEFAVNLLNKMAQELVNEELCLGEDAKTLITQTEAWLGNILAPLSLEVKPLKANLLELLIGGFRPSNVGFGYSSILPIIVTGLIAKPDEKIIIENPEIHLHPKAQSALVEFLVKVANTGVQIFIESHSDHILNGLLVQCKKFEENKGGIQKDDVTINYFHKDEMDQTKITKINIEEGGRIRYTPKGFFDQLTIDYEFLMGF